MLNDALKSISALRDTEKKLLRSTAQKGNFRRYRMFMSLQARKLVITSADTLS